MSTDDAHIAAAKLVLNLFSQLQEVFNNVSSVKQIWVYLAEELMYQDNYYKTYKSFVGLATQFVK